MPKNGIKNGVYSLEFKAMVVETIQRKSLCYSKTVRLFEIAVIEHSGISPMGIGQGNCLDSDYIDFFG